MLNHFKRRLTKLVARTKVRMDASQVRCVVERLEERAMLSASSGVPAHGYGAFDMGPHGGASPQLFGDSAAFASQQQRSMSYDTQTFYSVRETGSGYRDLQSRPPMQSAFGPPTGVSESRQLRVSEGGWNQFRAALPRDDAFSYRPEPAYVQNVAYIVAKPTYSSAIIFVETWPSSYQDKQSLRYADSDDGIPGTALGIGLTPPGFGGLPGGGIDVRQMNGPSDHYQPQRDPILRLTGPNLDARTSINSVLANIGSAISDLPTTQQLLSRDATTSTVLNAVAREVAFQEFSPTLFQANAATTYDRVNLDAIGQDTMQSEAVDGWIHPDDGPAVDVSADLSDAVARERAAVDAVLENLDEVDTLMPAMALQDVDAQNDLQTETALSDLPAGEVDGGMVLLQATGHANASGFDLTPVYAEHVGRFNMPAKMETSVGMFQAMDVASDDAPIVETVQQTDSPTQLNRDAGPEEKLPSKRESSTNKAATVIGVTTLTGALVWMNRSGSRIARPKPTAQKRRASLG